MILECTYSQVIFASEVIFSRRFRDAPYKIEHERAKLIYSLRDLSVRTTPDGNLYEWRKETAIMAKIDSALDTYVRKSFVVSIQELKIEHIRVINDTIVFQNFLEIQSDR